MRTGRRGTPAGGRAGGGGHGRQEPQAAQQLLRHGGGPAAASLFEDSFSISRFFRLTYFGKIFFPPSVSLTSFVEV